MKLWIILSLIVMWEISFAAEKKRYAILKNTVVENITIWDGFSKWNPGPGLTVVELKGDSKVNIGCSYDLLTKLFYCEENQ